MTAYNTRSSYTYYCRPIHMELYGTESISHLGPKIWEIVPTDMKNVSTLTAFKTAMQERKPHASYVGIPEPTSNRLTSLNF